KKMDGIIQALCKERGKLAKKRQEVTTRVLQAKENIAANFTRIIAQAISRCLDLMAQTEKVGRIRIEALDGRIAAINQSLKNTNKTMAIAAQSGTVLHLPTRLCVQKAVIAMSPPVFVEYEHLRNNSMSDAYPLLKLSFSHVVLNHIANLGKGIMTNLIAQSDEQFEVATLPTPTVAATRLMEFSNVTHFTQFHKALICMDSNRSIGNYSMPEPGLNAIGLIAAHIIEMPSRPEYFGVIETKSTDPSDRSPRFKLTCSKRRRYAAAAANTLNISTKTESTTKREESVIDRAIESSGQEGESPSDCQSIDQPGPSSPKRIKMEEEEEIERSKQMENLFSFAKDCEKAVKYEEELAGSTEDEIKLEVDG
ncbi:hypothetical protein PFISCL1PPCAC_22015, partial [Pristionchus fissidentatus]